MICCFLEVLDNKGKAVTVIIKHANPCGISKDKNQLVLQERLLM